MEKSNLYFDITRDTNIFIYGAGALGKQYEKSLTDCGYKIAGFIDKNADKIKSDKKIYLPVQIKPDNGSVVIVCVHNALWHEEIVSGLFDLGWKKVLFVPTGNQWNESYSKMMKKKYLEFQCKSAKALKEIPTIDLMRNCEAGYENDIVFSTEKYVVAMVDNTVVFSSLDMETIKRRGAEVVAQQYVNVPLLSMTPYIDLFKHIENSAIGNVNDFISVMKLLQDTFECSDEKFIADRYELYNELERKLNNGLEEFYYSPSPAFFNSNQRLQLIDGMSRATFLYIKGFRRIPVLLKKEDYDKYYNERVARKIKGYLTRDVYLKYPVEHPLFRNCSIERADEAYHIISTLLYYIGKENFKNRTVRNEIVEFGALSRMFCRLGANVTELCIEEDVTFWKDINELLYLQNISFKKIDKSKKDIVCLMSDICDAEETITKYQERFKDYLVLICTNVKENDLITLKDNTFEVKKLAWYGGDNPISINIIKSNGDSI